MTNYKNVMPFIFCLASMLLMQIGLASSVPVIHSLGAIHTSAYRLTIAALIVTAFCAVKKGKDIQRLFTTDSLLLGIAMAGMAIFFSVAIANMPLALATCIEFMGPLAVVCWYQKTVKSLLLVMGALIGIYLMLANYQENSQSSHVWSAFAAALCWASYIVLGKRISQSGSSTYGICPALLIAACAGLLASAWEPTVGLDTQDMPKIVGIALLYPLGTYILDMLALKSLKHSNFGILTSAEPIIALAIGVITLGQTLTYFQVAGLSLVVFANAASITEPERAEEV